MKVLFTCLFVCCVSSFGFSQIENETKIVEKYGQEWYETVRIESPNLLSLIDNYISHGFQVLTVDEIKYANFQPLEFIENSSKIGGFTSVEDFLIKYDSPNFNPLDYNFFPTSKSQVFKLKGINKIIYILPQDLILDK
jgi:hypothetical protein